MPTYDYKCKECENEFEEFQQMTDKPVKKCPKCGGKVQRLIGTGAGIVFKGSGFYETDYKKAPVSSESSKASSENKTEKSATKKCDANCNSCPAKKE